MLRLVHSDSTSTHINLTLHTLRTHEHCEKALSYLTTRKVNLNFVGSSRNSNLFITSRWIWIEKNPLYIFLNSSIENHFPFLDECVLSFFTFWCDEVTWILSTNFMKDRQGECGENFTSLQGVEVTKVVRKYLEIRQRENLNPLWGHRSISIDSDLGSLQPYFLVVMVTPASPFFACMQLNDKRSCWHFEKPSFCRKGRRFGPLNVRFPPSSRPAVELYAVLVVVSGLLSWKWTVCQRSIQAAI